MAALSHDVVEEVERRRAQLQENVDKLRKALSHWTTCEAEYEALRDEIQTAGDPTPSQIREIAHELACTVVTEKEVNELLGKDANSERNANQVVDLIDRRIDYVQQNSNTVEKQLNAAEKQLAGADVLLEPGVENEDGLPMMDIEEELDEEGNEISSSINQTGSSTKEIIEVLQQVAKQKAGKAGTSTESQAKDPAPPVSSQDQVAQTEVTSAAVEVEMKETSPPEPEPEVVEPKPKRKTGLEEHGYNEDIAAANFSRGTKVIELDDDDNMIASYPIIPQGESPEDAELRRQMLQYGLSEVGQVVAELDLDRPTASYSDDEDMDDDYDYDTDEDEEEDEYGRSTRSALTDDYRKQMLELQKKLGMQNIGPQQDDASLEEHAADIRTMKIQSDEQFDNAMASASSKDIEPPKSKEPSAKKGVRFADSLDISDAPAPVQQSPRPTVPTQDRVATMSDSIIERPVGAFSAPIEPPKPAKVSKFKMGRTVQQMPAQSPIQQTDLVSSPPPQGPAGRTLADSITEHQASSSTPQAPDEFDPAVIHREIEADYHKVRNKFIQQQGGFKQGPEDEEFVLENEDGTTKKVSRFMAARMKSSGL